MARSLPAEEIVCEHCGDRCRDASITMDDKPFCCTGCLTVYQLLHDNSLDDYYTIENRPGRKVLPGKHDSRFAYLDDPDVVTRLLDFDNGQMARMTFSVPQMHCASCVWLLENLYVLQKAVTSSRVDFPRREVSITWAPDQLSLRQLVEQLAVIGYEPTIRLADLDRPIRDRSIRMLYARLAVAGFAFGNVMLLSFPEYLGLDALATPAVADMFGWVNLLLALPVVAFSGWEFFRSAISGLRQRQINMDVPISLGILVLFLRSVHHIVVLGQGGYVDSLAGLVFLLLIGRLYQKKTYAALSFDRDYKSYLPLSVVRVQADGDVAVPVDRIQPGDRIRVRNRELIPADGILIDGPGRIDYSFVTGESDPVPVTCGEKVFAGGRQMGSALTLDVIKSPSQSYLMQLWTQGERVTGRGNGVISLSDRVSRIFTPTVVLLSLLAGVFWAAVDPSRMLNAMSAVLIVACPCALALSTPFTLGTISRIFGSNDFYLKDPSVVERLARVSSVVFDKTGTITSSQSTVPDFVGDAL
ncbi:MAG: heavy metal translocating P-type ATPase metal-binding domain-containing protein, partial [candidate division Zixibacteria bacterium]|nr:heavy metal translocating P-type ATPase metal-binding domain-containing protein [candidate division Zixibacteria bacterium]